MFWSKNTDKRKKKPGNKVSGCKGGSSTDEQCKSQRIRNEALAHMRQARATIGDETLDKIAALLEKKQNSALEQAKAAAARDPDRALDELMSMLREREQH